MSFSPARASLELVESWPQAHALGRVERGTSVRALEFEVAYAIAVGWVAWSGDDLSLTDEGVYALAEWREFVGLKP